ncbi:MAG: penicillin-binding transpeptidase domain-containing protein [Verrucomicrobiota bacterium]
MAPNDPQKSPAPRTDLAQPKKKKKRTWRRFFNLVLFAGVLLLIQGVIAAYLVASHYSEKAAQVDLNKLNEFPVSTLFYDRNGEELGRIFTENRTLLSQEEIPDLMRQAVISMEDERYYEHGGIDYTGLARAMVRNVRAGRIAQGGSTLTQQLAKHVLGDFSRSYERKLVEAFLALRIEKEYTKDEIINFYLNRIFFGKNHYGLASAARGYFDKEPIELSLGECATLAGIISAPNANSPRTSIKRASERRDIALQKMVDNGYITPQEAAEAKSIPLRVAPRQPLGVLNYAMAYGVKRVQEILRLDDVEEIPPGLKIYLTVDKNTEEQSQAALEKQIETLEKEAGRTTDAQNPLQGAAIVADARTGAIRVLIGGRDFLQSSFDRSYMSRRENGAINQPLLYALAFEELDLHPASPINASFYDLAEGLPEDEKNLGDPNKDLGSRFLTVHDNLALGLKYSAGRVAEVLGKKRILDFYREAGVDLSEDGKDELRPLTLWEAVQLYQVLANTGKPERLFLIERIEDPDGDVIYQHTPKPDKTVLNPLVAEQMTLTLEGAAQEGRAHNLSTDFGFPAPFAGIVGFSEGYRDAWFMGYTSDLVGGVWVGYDKSEQIADKKTAQKAALPVWNQVMREAMKAEGTNGEAFPVPAELAKVTVDRNTCEVIGQAFYSPGKGNIFVYLKQSQLNAANRNASMAAQRVQQSEDWTDWLSTMLAEETEDGLTLEESSDYLAEEIPPLAWFRMPAIRGDILTADGTPLAMTKQTQNLVARWPPRGVAPTKADALNWMADRINKASSWLGKDVEIPWSDLESLYTYKRFLPVTISEDLTPEQIRNFPGSKLPEWGFSLQGMPIRVYPQGDMAAHIIGFLNRKQGISNGKFLADEVIYSDYEGKSGLEGLFDEQLKGEEGKITIKTTPDGFVQRLYINKESSVGLNVRTTLNYKLQEITEKFVGEKHTASVVVIDPNNGDVVAMASRPTFNPNDFLPSLDPELWKDLTTQKRSPLTNRAISQHNPPGSTFKVLTAIAAMNGGVFSPDLVINCPGFVDAGSFRFELRHEAGGNVGFRRAMARSYNTYFMKMAMMSPRDVELDTAREWGFGEKTGIRLAGELPGMVPTPEFILKTHKRNMSQADLCNISIGQGDMLSTPLQVANFVAAVANNGTLFRPRIISALEDASGQIIEEFPTEIIRQIPVNQAWFDALHDSMLAVTEGGTATRYSKVPGIQVAGKTGTAQVGSKSRPRQIAWFMGYMPYDDPKYAFSVMVEGTFEEDLHGGSDAGLLAGKIFREYYKQQNTEVAQKDE